MSQSFLRKIINSQKFLSEKFDALLPKGMLVFANEVFDHQVVPEYLKNGLTIYDIGGGKLPNIKREQKEQYNLRVVGVDISEEELSLAPDGIYDETIAADVTQYDGLRNGDVVLCRALLEHVKDTQKALANIKSMTRPGGHILIFVPCRNAFFTRINMVLSEDFKTKLLRVFFPGRSERLGFKAYYDRCTPKGFAKIADEVGLNVKATHCCYNSHYFTVLFPFHFIWRLYQLVIFYLGFENLCEAYVMVLENPK